MEKFWQYPIESAKSWYNSIWQEEDDEDEDEETGVELKNSTDSSQYEGVVVLKVGLHCEECKRIVTNALWEMHGVEQVDVDKEMRKVTVTGKVSPKKVLRTVRRTGKWVELWSSDSSSYNASSSAPINNTNSNASAAADGGDEDEQGCIIM